MTLKTSPSQTGTPRAPSAVPCVESQIARDISVQSRDFGVKIRDWKGNQENRKRPKRGDSEKNTTYQIKQ